MMYVLKLTKHNYVIADNSSNIDGGPSFLYTPNIDEAMIFKNSMQALFFLEEASFQHGRHGGFKAGGLSLVEVEERSIRPSYIEVRTL